MIIRNTNLVVENLYYLLWLKDSGLKDASFNVKIPDTIIIQSGKIMNWFFTSKNGEGILMKKDFNLKNTKIYESFTRNESKSGIAAMFIENIRTDLNSQDQNKSHFASQQRTHGSQDDNVKFDIPKNEGQIIIRYLTKEKLKELLFTDAAENRSGILQKFIDPYGENQASIQAIWSPQLCIFSKRVNYRHLFDKRYDPYERLTTFDGAEMYSRTVPLRGKVISQEMRKFCENIVQRIAHVSFQKIMIQRMVVYFKADKNNNLYFLYCSSMRLHGEKIDPDILDENQYKIKNTPLILDTNYSRPEEIKLIQTTNTMRPISLENNLKCFYCQQKIQSKDLVAVTYEFIINNFEENPHAQYSKVSSIPVIEVPKEQNFILNTEEHHYVKDKTSEIPELLTKLYPKLTVENYRKLRQNKKFLNQKIKLCQYCYLDFSRYIKMSGAPLKGYPDFTFMKRGLAKKGSLFTREMKAIVAAKNVEMAEQKGAEFVKYQNKEVYQRMLDHLVEEMERIQRERKKKVDINIDTNKERSFDDEIMNEDTSTRIGSASVSNKFALSRPQSCTNFNTGNKLKEIQKQIELFENKLGKGDQNQNHSYQNSSVNKSKHDTSKRQKSKEYIDQDYLELNEYDQASKKGFSEPHPGKYINPEQNQQNQQLEYQYKLNANFINTKRSQLKINTVNNTQSLKDIRKVAQRPQSTTFNSSGYKINQNSTKDTHPTSGNPNSNHKEVGNILHHQELQTQIKKSGSFVLNKPYRIQTATVRQNQQQHPHNIGNYGSISTIKSPMSTKFSSQTAIQVQKAPNQNYQSLPQRVTFSNITRPQSHQVTSNQNNLAYEIEEKDERTKTEDTGRNKKEEYIRKSHSGGVEEIEESEPIFEQNHDDFESSNEFNYERLDFDFQEVNEDYLNQRE